MGIDKSHVSIAQLTSRRGDQRVIILTLIEFDALPHIRIAGGHPGRYLGEQLQIGLKIFQTIDAGKTPASWSNIIVYRCFRNVPHSIHPLYFPRLLPVTPFGARSP